jgi:hypothetical protein
MLFSLILALFASSVQSCASGYTQATNTGAGASTEKCRDGYRLTTDKWWCQKTENGAPSHYKEDGAPQKYLRECVIGTKPPNGGYWKLNTKAAKCSWKLCVKD